jgi:hypothetical protein
MDPFQSIDVFTVDGMSPELLTGIKRIKTELALVLILFFAAIIRCYEITLPYGKTWEIAFQEIIAKNHLVFGFNQTHFLSVISVVDGQNIYHLSHPPLLQILIASSYFFFGIHEWSARLIPILFSLGTIFLIFMIAERVWNPRTALFAAFFAAFMPMSAYFGRIVNFEPPVLFFILLFTYAYLVWSETGASPWFFVTVSALILGGLTDWPFFLVLPFFVIISLATRKKIKETVFLFLIGCGVAGGYLFLKNSLVGYKSGVSDWFGHLLFRSNIPAFIGNPDLYSLTIGRLWNNFSLTIILAVMGVLVWIYLVQKRQGTYHNLTTKELVPAALLAFGLSYLIIFLESTYTHEWQMYYLIPGVSLYAGFTLSSVFPSTLTSRSKAMLGKLGCILVLIIFLAFSAQSLFVFNNGKSYESYYFGSRINEWTTPGDYICIIGLIDPLIYYADRPLIQNPVDDLPDYAQLRKSKPKIVAFPSKESSESPWSRKELIRVLKEENYNLLNARNYFEIWVRDIVVPDILVRDIDSIEVRDPLTGETIPYKNNTGGVPPPQIIYKQQGLYEHPLVKGTIRTNYLLDIANGSLLTFGIGLDEKTWDSKMGDGVLFEIYCQSGGNETRLFSQYIDPKNNPADRRLQYFSVPMGTCSGNTMKIGFATSSGPKEDNSYDWAYWSNPRIEAGLPKK